MIKSLLRVFYSPKYTALFVVLFNTLALGVSMLVSIFAPLSGASSAILLCTMIYFGGDFFTFNGIVLKNMPFGILKNSLKGEKVLSAGLLLDMVLHFLIMYIILLADMLVAEGISAMGIIKMTICALLVAALEQGLLNALRYVCDFQIYGLLVPLAGMVPALVGYLCLEYLPKMGIAVSVLLLIVTAILAYTAAVLSGKHIKKRYYESFIV